MDQTRTPLRPKSLVTAELTIAYVLRYGVILCGAIMLAGIVMMLLQPGGGSLLAVVRSANPAALDLAPRSAEAFGRGLAALDPNAIIALGMVLLIALPIVRVGLTVIIFLLEKDWVYLGVTLFVFAVLIAGVVLGKAL